MVLILAGGSWLFAGARLGPHRHLIAYIADEWCRGMLMWMRWRSRAWAAYAKFTASPLGACADHQACRKTNSLAGGYFDPCPASQNGANRFAQQRYMRESIERVCFRGASLHKARWISSWFTICSCTSRQVGQQPNSALDN